MADKKPKTDWEAGNSLIHKMTGTGKYNNPNDTSSWAKLWGKGAWGEGGSRYKAPKPASETNNILGPKRNPKDAIQEVKSTGVRKPAYQGANTLSEVKVTGQRKAAYKAPASKTSTPVQGGGAQRASSGSQKATGGSSTPTRRSKSMEGKSLADFLGLGADSAVRRSMGRRAEMRKQVAQRKGKK